MVNLGDLVEDKISGLQGIVICRSVWLYNCVRIVVQPEKMHDGRPVESCTFDEDQLTVLQAGKLAVTIEKETIKAPTGGNRNYIDNR